MVSRSANSRYPVVSCGGCSPDLIERSAGKESVTTYSIYVAFHEPHHPGCFAKGLVDKFEGATRNRGEVHYFAKVTNLDPGVGE